MTADYWRSNQRQNGASLSGLRCCQNGQLYSSFSDAMPPSQRVMFLLRLTCADQTAPLCGCGSLLVANARQWLHTLASTAAPRMLPQCGPLQACSGDTEARLSLRVISDWTLTQITHLFMSHHSRSCRAF